MKVALVQFDTLHCAPQANIATIEQLLAEVECDLVVLPEMFATGYNTNAEAIAEESYGPTRRWMESYAAEHNCGVVGSVAVRERGEYRNRLYVCLPDGTTCHYDKRHLFTFAGEDKSFSAGKERIVVEWMGVRILPLVCYDLRFPAWSYLPGAVDLIIYSAAWPAGRIGAWQTLLPARAIENQAWVVGVNRLGNDLHNTPHSGHSAAYDYLGHKVVDCNEVQRVEVVEIDPEKCRIFREKFRAWQDADQITIK